MFKISSNGIVTVNRGDSFKLPIKLNKGNFINSSTYTLKETDALYVGIMEPNQPFETAIVRKKVTYDDLNSATDVVVKFSPSDTVCLLPGKYYYQVKLQIYDELNNVYDVETIIDKTLFYIQE